MDPSLNELLKWGIENSAVSKDPDNHPSERSLESAANMRALDPELIKHLLGGPSDADRMKDAMAAIQNPEVDLENKLIAFDNLEQFLEGIDNANNLEPLKLWAPLVEQLEAKEEELRMYAAWCIGTAVQNNVKAQAKLHDLNGIPILAKISTSDPSQQTRKKAILALSSAIRNYQPSLDVALKDLPDEHKVEGKVDATDMEAVDAIVAKLREASAKMGSGSSNGSCGIDGVCS